MLEGQPEEISAGPEPGRPNNSAACIEDKETRPRQMVDPGQERRERPQERDETPEEDDFPAVSQEQILRDLEPPLVDVQDGAIAINQRKAEFAPDPIAEIVPDDRRSGGAKNDQGDVQ